MRNRLIRRLLPLLEMSLRIWLLIYCFDFFELSMDNYKQTITAAYTDTKDESTNQTKYQCLSRAVAPIKLQQKPLILEIWGLEIK